MTSLTSNQTPLAAIGSTLSIVPTNQATDLQLSLGSLEAAGDSVRQAKRATIIIANNGTAQSITAASLQFFDAQSSGFSYRFKPLLSGNDIANDATGTFSVDLPAGVLENLVMQLHFDDVPTTGLVNVNVLLHAGDIEE